MYQRKNTGNNNGGKKGAKYEFYPMKKINPLMKNIDGNWVPNSDGFYVTTFKSEGIDAATKQPYKSIHCKLHFTEGEEKFMPGFITPLLKVAWPASVSKGEGNDDKNPQGANFGGFADPSTEEKKDEKKAAPKLTLSLNVVPPQEGEQEFYRLDENTAQVVGQYATIEGITTFMDVMDNFDVSVIEFYYDDMKKDAIWSIGRQSKVSLLESMTRSINPAHENEKGDAIPPTMKTKIKTDLNTGDLKTGSNGVTLFRYNYEATDASKRHVPITKPEGDNKFIWQSIKRNSLVRCVLTEPTLWKAGKNFGISWHLNQMVIYQDGVELSGNTGPQPCLLDEEESASNNNTNAGTKRKAESEPEVEDEHVKKQRPH